MIPYIWSKVIEQKYGCYGLCDYHPTPTININSIEQLNQQESKIVLYYYQFIKKHVVGYINVPSKFDFYIEMQNEPTMAEYIDEINNIYNKCQRVYYSLLRFKNIVKIKKTPVQHTDDLYMNPIDQNSRQTVKIVQENKLYLFTLFDLCQIITNAITSSVNFFSVPTIIKNPYNNIPLSKLNLYNIYFQLKRVWSIIPVFIVRFFECDFNIYKFKTKYENEILEYNVEKYVKTKDAKVLAPHTVSAIFEYNTNHLINAPSNMEQMKKIVEFFRPVLITFFLHKHTMNKYKREYYGFELKYKMPIYIQVYASFGDVIYDTPISEFNKKIKRMMKVDDWKNTHIYSERNFNYYTMYGSTTPNEFNQSTLSPTDISFNNTSSTLPSYSTRIQPINIPQISAHHQSGRTNRIIERSNSIMDEFVDTIVNGIIEISAIRGEGGREGVGRDVSGNELNTPLFISSGTSTDRYPSSLLSTIQYTLQTDGGNTIPEIYRQYFIYPRNRNNQDLSGNNIRATDINNMASLYTLFLNEYVDGDNDDDDDDYDEEDDVNNIDNNLNNNNQGIENSGSNDTGENEQDENIYELNSSTDTSDTSDTSYYTTDYDDEEEEEDYDW